MLTIVQNPDTFLVIAYGPISDLFHPRTKVWQKYIMLYKIKKMQIDQSELIVNYNIERNI